MRSWLFNYSGDGSYTIAAASSCEHSPLDGMGLSVESTVYERLSAFLPHVNLTVTSLLAPFELGPPGTPYTKPVKMATRTHKAKVSLLDDRIDVLNKDAAEASPAKQVFRTVSTTLALVRVSVPFCVRLWALINIDNRTRTR